VDDKKCFFKDIGAVSEMKYMVLPPAYYFYAFADEEKHVFVVCMIQGLFFEFCYGVYNQCESFICLDLMVKNREVPIERYFKW
jgi:hypothetical protein